MSNPAALRPSERAYDVLVFGATGFTGQWILSAIAGSALSPRDAPIVKLGAAGRRRARLEEVISRVRAEVPAFQSPIGIMLADVSDPDSLKSMAASTRLLVNAVGPFRFSGEAVVQACISEQTDYLDITGEPEFMERMELQYDAAARAAGVLVVSSCGFDSIPADIGCIFACDTLRGAGATPSSVESFLSLKSGPRGMAGHFATFESAVHGFGSADDLRAIRKQYAKVHPEASAPVPALGQKLARREGLFWSSERAAWAVPFLGADASIVKRTQRIGLVSGALKPACSDRSSGSAAQHRPVTAGEDEESVPPAVPIQFAAYSTLGSAWGAALYIAFGSVFQLLARYAWGRSLLLRFPGLFSNGIFSHAGPTREQIAGTSFAMTFYVKGYSRSALAALQDMGASFSSSSSAGATRVPPPDVSAVVQVTGPEPGYDATSRIVAAAVATLLRDRHRMGVSAGVVTPGAAFRGTHVLEQLERQGIHFQVLSPPAVEYPRRPGASGGDQ